MDSSRGQGITPGTKVTETSLIQRSNFTLYRPRIQGTTLSLPLKHSTNYGLAVRKWSSRHFVTYPSVFATMSWKVARICGWDTPR
jgi:hypothetical protein